MNDQEVLVMLTPRVIRLPEPGVVDGSAVPMAAGGGTEEHPGFIENPRADIPTP